MRSNTPIMMIKRVTVFFLLCLTCQHVFAAKAEFFRYKNENGHVVIVDQLSPYAIEHGYEIVDVSGRLIQKVGPAKTLGEIKDEQSLLKEKKRQEKEKLKQLQKDIELLRLFSSIRDIERVREGQLLGVEQRRIVNSTDRNFLKIDLEALQKKAANYERAGTQIPVQLVESIQLKQEKISQLLDIEKKISQDEQKIRKAFENKIIRYKELQANRTVKKMRLELQKNNNNSTVIQKCTTHEACNKMWQLAQVYALNNASGRIEIITDTLILTESPKKESDISLSFSKIPEKEGHNILLEITCFDSEAGEELCKSDTVRKISRGFLKTIREKKL